MCIKLYVTYLLGVVSSNVANPRKIMVICQTSTHQVQNYYLQNTEHCFWNFFSYVVCSEDWQIRCCWEF